MVNDFSIIDVRIIQSLLDKKPIDYIAMIIDKPLDAVINKVKELTTDTGRLSFADKQHNRTLRQKTSDINKNLRKVHQHQHKIKKAVAPVYKTKVVDYSQMVLVKIDSKTSIHVPAGSDIQKAKEHFLQHHKSFAPAVENPWKKVSKFK